MFSARGIPGIKRNHRTNTLSGFAETAQMKPFPKKK